MKKRHLGYCVVSSLCLFLAVPNWAKAEISNGVLYIVSDDSERSRLSEDLGLRFDETGFNTMPGPPIMAPGGSYTAEPFDTSNIVEVKAGDFLIFCFAAISDAKARVININADGVTSQIFPPAPSVSELVGGETYCLGGSDSALSMQAPNTSGLATLYVVGSETGIPPGPVQMPGAVSNEEPTGISEVRIRYRVEGPNK